MSIPARKFADKPPAEPPAIEILRDILRELRLQRQQFDEFARAFLNAKFPHGEPTDRATLERVLS